MLSSFGKTDCATSRLFNNVIRGVKEENNVFGGLEGLKFFWGTVSNEISSVSPTTAAPAETEVNNLRTALTNFVTTFSDDTITACTNNANTFSPDIIQNIATNINPFIANETAILTEAALTTQEGVRAANSISLGLAIVTYRLALGAFGGELDEFITNMTRFETQFRDGVNWSTNESFAKIALWTVLISTLVVLALYLLLMRLTLKGKCINSGKFFQGILALMKLFFGLIITILGVITVILAVFAVNGCFFAKKGMDDRVFMEALINNPNRMKYVDLCLFQTSSGNMSELLLPPFDDEFYDISQLMNALQLNYTQLNTTLDTAASYTSYLADLNGAEDYSKDDFTKTPNENPVLIANARNPTVACANDEWRLNAANCGRSPISTSTDPEVFNNSPAQPYCMVIPNLGYNTVDTRYNSGGVAGCASPAIPDFARLKTCVESHDTKLDEMKTDFNDNVDANMRAVLGVIKSKETYFKNTGD